MRKILFFLAVPLTLLLSGCGAPGGYYGSYGYGYGYPYYGGYYGYYGGHHGYGYGYGHRHRGYYSRPYSEIYRRPVPSEPSFPAGPAILPDKKMMIAPGAGPGPRAIMGRPDAVRPAIRSRPAIPRPM